MESWRVLLMVFLSATLNIFPARQSWLFKSSQQDSYEAFHSHVNDDDERDDLEWSGAKYEYKVKPAQANFTTLTSVSRLPSCGCKMP
eukprot:scaffold383_cov310-Alexandrium_tamarense.AAC.2